MGQLPLFNRERKVGQVFKTSCFGVCQIIEIVDEAPSPAYELIPLEFEHPMGTVTCLDEDLLAEVAVEEVVCASCGVHFFAIKTDDTNSDPDEVLLCRACSNGGEG